VGSSYYAYQEGCVAARCTAHRRANISERAVGERGDRGARRLDDRGRSRGSDRAARLRGVRGQEDEGKAEGQESEDERDGLHPEPTKDILQAQQALEAGSADAVEGAELHASRRKRGQPACGAADQQRAPSL